MRNTIFILLMGGVMLIIFFSLFPLILEGNDIVNSTENLTQYQGLPEINAISPLLIFISGIITIAGAVWLAAFPSGRRFAASVKRGASEVKRQWDEEKPW